MDAAESLLRKDLLYLTEAGVETEILYKHGYELPHFAMFTLLDNPDAVADMIAMFERYLDVAAEAGTGALICGMDYRLSPDWIRLLGYDAAELVPLQARCIAFLRDVAARYRETIPHLVIGGSIGPRGDAYGTGGGITTDEAEAYHTPQLNALKQAGADLACALTFNNIPEAIGVTRAAKAVGLPIAVYFPLSGNARLSSGPSLRDAIETTEAETGGSAAFYGINCSHPLEFEPAIDDCAWMNRVLSLRPNAAKMDKVALCKLGHLEDGDPVELGQQIGDLKRRYPHMNVLGGCCGTDERHLREIARTVAGHASA